MVKSCDGFTATSTCSIIWNIVSLAALCLDASGFQFRISGIELTLMVWG